MATDIGNTELTPADIPSFKEPWALIEPFALTFDGFKHWGSVEKCAAIAENPPSTLTQLRTCLFYEARRWKNMGRQPDEQAMKRIRALVYAIREKVNARDFR